MIQPAANPPFKLPPRLFDARCKACWFMAGLLVLVGFSFWSLDLQWAQFFSLDAARSMGRFIKEFFPPDLSPAFVRKVAIGAVETLAMSLLGTVLAAVFGLLLALPASRMHAADRAMARAPTRLLLNALRAIPELVWAALLLISAGLGRSPARWRWPCTPRACSAACLPRRSRTHRQAPASRCAPRAWATCACFVMRRCRRCCRN
jgi:phosphonate transport system permease protein